MNKNPSFIPINFHLAGKVLFVSGLGLILLNAIGQMIFDNSLIVSSMMVVVGMYLIVVPK